MDKRKSLLSLNCGTTYPFEIGVDEVGRGPLFGRVYAAAVVLPSETTMPPLFDISLIKDSKKFTSAKKYTKCMNI